MEEVKQLLVMAETATRAATGDADLGKVNLNTEECVDKNEASRSTKEVEKITDLTTESEGKENPTEEAVGNAEPTLTEREVVHLAEEGERTKRRSPVDEAARARAAIVHIYRRRPAREEASAKQPTMEQLKEAPERRAEGNVEGPTRGTVDPPRRRRRVLINEEPKEEDEDVVFTLIEEMPRSGQTSTIVVAAESERERKERKRKGKAIAAPAKKKPRQAPSTLAIQEERQRTEEDDDEVEETLRRERRSKRQNDGARRAPERRPELARVQFEKMKVRLDNDLLGRMVEFDDPQTTEECRDRIGKGKQQRSGRRLDQEILEELEASGEFMELITRIGFDWLLVPEAPKMPIELAQEFFTSFHFTFATDVGEESIRFRLFTREMRMSIREWSVRLGLYTADQEAEWFARDIGTPKEIPKFSDQAAWTEMVPEGTNAYQPTESTADCLVNPVLRLAQVFVGANLLCQANTAAPVTEAELYFLWCMMRKRKVHLGYWLARTCQSISSRAARNLNGCHILGAVFRNCVEMVITERIPKMSYCPKPELFGRNFLTCVGVLVQRGGVLRFYEVTKHGSQPVGATKKKNKKKQLEVVVAETEMETSAPTEVAARTLRIQGDITMPSTSNAPEASPAHVSLADTAGQIDPWRSRLEGLVERIALNTNRIAQSSEAHTQLLTAQTEA